MYDIVIVGAGPSGSALASLLDKKFKVLILDKRSVLHNGITDELKAAQEDDLLCGKCCGGMLSPNAQKALAMTRWIVPRDILVTPQVYALKILDIKTKMRRLYQRNYININRKKFDKWLLDKAMKKATIIQNAAYKGAEKTEDGYRISYLKNGEIHTEETRMIVGADGAQSRVRKEFFKNVKTPKQYAAIQEWYKTEVPEPFYYGIADKDVTDFYSWIIPKENYLILGSAMDDMKNANKKFEILKNKLEKEGFSFKKEDLVKKEGSIIFRPKSMREIALVKDDVALIGEASGIISPSSSEGIGYALRSAIILAEELNKDKNNALRKYKKKAKKLAFSCVAKSFRSPFLYGLGGIFRRVAMKSKLMTIKETNI
ncbi:MAG: FAD-binding protein [Clostridia bacterium]|nr:FAD-binding protein [Clostridia bacterium]